MRLNMIQDMLEESPEDTFLHFALAKEYEKMGEHNKALIPYEWIRENDPDYVGMYYHLAAVAIELDKPAEYIVKAFEEGVACANKLGDHHALAELKNAYMNWEMEN